MQTEMMTQQATCAFFGGDRPIHYSTLYRGIAAGRYPRPVAVGPNTKRWQRSECEAALKTLIAARDSASGACPFPSFARQASPSLATEEMAELAAVIKHADQQIEEASRGRRRPRAPLPPTDTVA